MATTEKINLLSRVASVDVAPTFTNYSKVIIHIDDETVVESGDDTGRTLEIDDPFGSQELADQMLARLRGYQYQPLYASSALLDPAAEIGDGVSVKGIYSGIYQRTRTFNQLMPADIAAPHDEEINHEYKFVTAQERNFNRQIGNVKASLLIQAGLIEAKVSKESPDGQTSFSWAMNDTSHTWYANGSRVMRVNASGLEITGRVTATEGYIGTASKGFVISASAIYNGVTGLTDTSHNGVYVGTDGIVCGKGAFKADSKGNVSANNMTLTGTLKIGGKNITAGALRSGAQSAYGWTQKDSSGTSQAGRWTTGSGYGYDFNGATKSGTSSYPDYFTCGTLYCNRIVCDTYATTMGDMGPRSVGTASRVLGN